MASTLNNSSSTGWDYIVFDTSRQKFVAYKAGAYYANWSDSADYVDQSTFKPRKDRLFVSNTNGKFYRYNGSANLLTVFKTYEWLYRFYDMKYPSIVQGDSVPNSLGGGYASIGTMDGTFNSWIYSTYGIESATMEFSDHVWTPELHTSVAMSVAVNMYLNQFVQHICARFKYITPKVDSSDIYPAKG